MPDSQMRDEVTLDGVTIKLFSRGKLVDAQRYDTLDRAYRVRAGSQRNWFALDVEFDVFRFSDKLWVLPRKTAGVHAAINAIWPEQKERSARSWIAAIS